MFDVDLPVVGARLTLALARWAPELPEQPIAVLRGLLGHGLGGPQDPAFAEAFKQPLDGDVRVPRPFLIDCRATGGGGDSVRARVRFYGRGQRWVVPCIEAIKARERHGFNGIPYRLDVNEIVACSVPWAADSSTRAGSAWSVEFLTPTRLKMWNTELSERMGPVALLDPDARQCVLHAVVWGAARRLLNPLSFDRDCGLAVAYGDAAPIDAGLEARIKDILDASAITQAQLTRVAQTWRGRDTGGYLGRFEVEGPPELGRILAAGELTGIGQSTAHGCGRLDVETL